MSILHTGIRAYVFECTYSGYSWIDNPTQLVTDIKTTLVQNMTNFSYKQLKVANVKNILGKKIEIEIVGITHNNKTKLNATDNNDLIYNLNQALLAVTNLTFQRINICNDVFTEDQTSGWPGQSFQTDNS